MDAFRSCPKCGKIGASHDYEIDADGQITYDHVSVDAYTNAGYDGPPHDPIRGCTHVWRVPAWLVEQFETPMTTDDGGE